MYFIAQAITTYINVPILLAEEICAWHYYKFCHSWTHATPMAYYTKMNRDILHLHKALRKMIQKILFAVAKELNEHMILNRCNSVTPLLWAMQCSTKPLKDFMVGSKNSESITARLVKLLPHNLQFDSWLSLLYFMGCVFNKWFLYWLILRHP